MNESASNQGPESTVLDELFFLKAQQDASLSGLLTLDKFQKIKTYNQRFLNLWHVEDRFRERSLNELLAYILPQLKYPDDMLKHLTSLSRNTSEKVWGHTELRDGTSLDWYTHPIVSAQGHFEGRVWSFQKLSSPPLRDDATEAYLKAMVEGIQDGVYALDSELKMVAFNSSFRETLSSLGVYIQADMTLEELLLDYPLVDENEKQAWHSYFLRALKGESLSFETKIVAASGTLYFEVALHPILLQDEVRGVLAVHKNRTLNKKYELQLQLQREHYETILNFLPIHIFEKDADNAFIYSNQHLHQMTGLQPHEILGKTNAEVFGDRVGQTLQEAEDKLRTTQLSHIQVESILEPDTQPRFLRSQHLLLEPQTPETSGIVGYFMDVTEQKQAEQDMLQAKEVAEEANRTKSEFIASVSHEVRTPLNAITGFTELLAQELDHPTHQKYIQAIQTGSQALLTLINDILDLSKIEAGQMRIQPEPIDLRRLMKDVYHIFEQKSAQKKLGFELHLAPELPNSLLLDEVRMRQILFNLVGNALKFTDTGSVKMRAFIAASQTDVVELVLEVEDTGIGIPESAQSSIFESFRQQDGQSTKKYGGTGLGLSITKRLIEMMRGSLHLKSEVGQGTLFTVVLPGVQRLDSEQVKPEPLKALALESQSSPIQDDYPLTCRQELQDWLLRLSKNQSFKQLSLFSKALSEMGQIFERPELLQLSESLSESIGQFDIGQITQTLDEFKRSLGETHDSN